MTIAEFTTSALHLLSGIPTARLDTEVLVADALGKNRAWVLAHSDFELPGDSLERLEKQISRRRRHEPLAYIRGHSEFFGREFEVTADTLQPRPETETMIEMFLARFPVGDGLTLADIGTGSGCLAITAKLERPPLTVLATDESLAALAVALRNGQALAAEIEWLKSDLITALPTAPDIILANLPYVPNEHTINQAAMNEPAMAIFGGVDGLDLYRALFEQLSERDWRPAHVFTESLPPQHAALTKIAADCGYEQIDQTDFIQLFSPAAQRSQPSARRTER